jgi:outer membrane protein
MRKIVTSSLLLATLYSASASADFLGIYVGAGSWNHDPSGNFNSTQTGSTNVDLQSNLGLSDESEGYVWAAFDHPIPLLPNIRLERTSLGHTGTSGSVNFNGATVSGSSTVNLDSTDAILYYRLLDNWVNFDLGLNLRKIDGEFAIGSESVSVSETIPMLYLAAQFDLPFSGFSVGADYSLVSYDGSSYDDLRLRAMYEMGVVGFELGLRTTTLELDDVDNINADLEFDGIMAGVFLHF